jgi:hypothetical protein
MICGVRRCDLEGHSLLFTPFDKLFEFRTAIHSPDARVSASKGLNGENYWLPVVDDATRLIEGTMLKNKSDAFHKLTAFCAVYH